MNDYEAKLSRLHPETMLAQLRADVDSAEKVALMKLLDGDEPTDAVRYIGSEMRLNLETLELWFRVRAERDRTEQLAAFRAAAERIEGRRVGAATAIGAWMVRRIVRRSASPGREER